MGRKTIGAGVVGALVVGLGVTQLLPTGSAPLSAPPAVAAGLVAYDACPPLLAAFRAELARTATAYGWPSANSGIETFAIRSGAAAAVPVPAAGVVADSAGAVGAGGTGTNVQEQGVDEPDVAKLQDGLLVTLAQGALQVVQAGAAPRRLGSLALPEGAAESGELLLDGPRALVVSRDYATGVSSSGATSAGGAAVSGPAGLPVPGRFVGPLRGFYGTGRTTLRLADLSTPAAPRWLQQWTVDGDYVSARLTGGLVRLVTRTTPTPVPAQVQEPYGTAQGQAALLANQQAAQRLTLEQLLPQQVRTVEGRVVAQGPALRCQDVSAASGAGSGLLSVTTLRPATDLAPLGAVAVQADGDLVYAAADRLFVATSRWGTGGWIRPGGGTPDTQLHAFDTTGDRVRYVGTGTVPGYVNGRWALSWYGGSLRVATTGSAETEQGGTTVSTLTVLRESKGALVPVGSLSGLGRGERIQAVRYLGELATVVTFRQTDPLYVLDLAKPDDPRLLGELKLPGFSTYLHPVGDHRLLGIGMEADVDSGRTTGVQASLFDLSNPAEPAQVSRIQLGVGYSQALSESRAFGYAPAGRLAVLPFTGEDVSSATGLPSSAALGIRVGPDGVLREAGRLAVGTQAQLSRVLDDGQHVYAVTDVGVVAGSSLDLARTGSVSFPQR